MFKVKVQWTICQNVSHTVNMQEKVRKVFELLRILHIRQRLELESCTKLINKKIEGEVYNKSVSNSPSKPYIHEAIKGWQRRVVN
jgi:uncharacterized radical SAM superfamily Fe-S cluster-containing enzyme